MAIEAELRRVDTFMNAITRPKVAKVCHDTLFVAHMRDVLTQPSGLESTLWALGDDAGEGAVEGAGAGAGSRVDKVRGAKQRGGGMRVFIAVCVCMPCFSHRCDGISRERRMCMVHGHCCPLRALRTTLSWSKPSAFVCDGMG